ncbi:DUF2510 domain-containing protein [Streptomyces sp. NPDC127033]|uniref:DUF2510 domain-containing protein n=1 Tax=Streptomyces sp. NPDC127033 TaxID=3347110 RepID=UPI00364B57CA
MTTTPPPGWYPDPNVPATERWWDGTVWTAHTRPPGAVPAPGGGAGTAPGGGRKRLITLLAVGLAAAAVVTAVALRPGGDDSGAAPHTPESTAPPTTAPPERSAGDDEENEDAEPEEEPSEDPTRLTDQLNGITLPIPDGWERPTSVSGGDLMVHTADTYACPGAPAKECRHGTLSSRTASGTDKTSPEALAEEDIEKAAQEAFGDAEYLDYSTHRDITSHTVVLSRATVVAGRTGHLVRWKVTTGAGPGGYVQSLAFPSAVGTESPVIVRTAFDAGPGGPPLTLMDTITEGIRPIGDVSGGVGSSIGP